MFLRLGRHEISPRTIVAATGVLTVIAIAITIAVVLAGRPRPAPQPEPDVVVGDFDWIDVSSFVVENELERGTELRWIPFRERMERWSDAIANEHWIDPSEIGIDVLSKEVDDSISQILEDVP